MATYSTQANSDKVTQAGAASQGIDGGLNLKTDTTSLQPPATTRADNAWHISPGQVAQLPGFASAMPTQSSHIYSLLARDLQQPSTVGCMMVHGEVADVPGSANNFWTTPCWSHANGTALSRAQPVTPYNLRTRPVAGRLGVTRQGSVQVRANSTDGWNMITARQEVATSSATRRFMLGYYDNQFGAFNATFGLHDGLQETGESLTVAFVAQYVEAIGIQGTSNWALVYLQGNNIFVSVYDFQGNLQSGPTGVASNVQIVFTAPAQLSQQQVSFTTVNHCGRTYLAYVANAAPFAVTLYDILAGTSLSYTPVAGQSTAPTGGFTVFSPTTHQAPGTYNYLGMVYDGKFFVLTRLTATPATGYFSPAQTLPMAGTNGVGINGWVNTLCTGAAVPADSTRAGATGSKIAFSVFRHYSEKVIPTDGPNTGGAFYQSVAVDTFSVRGNGSAAATVTANNSNVFRTPSGSAIVSKAFAAAPSESNYAGAAQSVATYCAVRMGPFEPAFGGTLFNADNGTYGQPTYFLIDNQARICGRWSNGQASPGGALGNAANGLRSLPPSGLGAPLVTDTLATANDMSALDVVVPTWTITNFSRPLATRVQAGGLPTYTTTPTYAYLSPVVASFSVSSTGSLPPSVSAGTYSVMSGSLTCIHDGKSMVEAGYHTAANNPMPVANTSGVQNGAAGLYYYKTIWEWTDAQGRLHRSQQSLAAGINASTGFFGANVSVSPPLGVKAAVGSAVIIRLYRSGLNATDGQYYLCSSLSIPAGTYQYYYTLSDAVFADLAYYTAGSVAPSTPVLQDQPKIYTQASAAVNGLVYDATPPPPFFWQCQAKGRAFGLAQVLGQARLYYTNALTDIVPFEWNALNYAPVPADLGDARSIEALDDKVVVFGSKLIGFLGGDGPPPANTVGTPAPNDGYNPIYPLPSPAGVIGTGGPARTPDGVVFQGFSGFQLLGRDLTVQPLGAQVDAITGRQVGNQGIAYGRSQTLASLQSVVWASPQAPSLVYSYMTKKWSTWPLLSNATCLAQRLDGLIVAAVQPIVANAYLGPATAATIGCDLGTLGTTFSPIYTGQNTAAGLVLETPWIQPSGSAAGTANVWDMIVTGGFLGAHTLLVEQALNLSATYTSAIRYNVTTTPPQGYIFRTRPPGGANFQSIRYRISLLPATTLAAGYLMADVSNLVIDSGQKQGGTRTGATQSG